MSIELHRTKRGGTRWRRHTLAAASPQQPAPGAERSLKPRHARQTRRRWAPGAPFGPRSHQRRRPWQREAWVRLRHAEREREQHQRQRVQDGDAARRREAPQPFGLCVFGRHDAHGADGELPQPRRQRVEGRVRLQRREGGARRHREKHEAAEPGGWWHEAERAWLVADSLSADEPQQ